MFIEWSVHSLINNGTIVTPCIFAIQALLFTVYRLICRCYVPYLITVNPLKILLLHPCTFAALLETGSGSSACFWKRIKQSMCICDENLWCFCHIKHMNDPFCEEISG